MVSDITGGAQNTTTITITATQNQINATLANATGAVYHNTPDYNGSDTFTVTTDDQSHTGSGGPLTDVDNVNITINAVADIVNDSPTTSRTRRSMSWCWATTRSRRHARHHRCRRGLARHGCPQRQRHGRQYRRRLHRLYADRRLQRLRQLHLHGDLGRRDRAGDRQRHRHRGRRYRQRQRYHQRGHCGQRPGAGERHVRRHADAITGTTNGTHGTVSVNDNGTAGNTADDFVVYTPTADYNGADSFTYTVTSGGVTEQATVNVTVNAVADIADNFVTVAEDSGADTLDLLANDSFENAGRAITAVAAALHGTTAINTNGTPGVLTDDFVAYTPPRTTTATDTFTYTVTSPAGVTETATVSVNVNAVADIVDDTATTNEDTPVQHPWGAGQRHVRECRPPRSPRPTTGRTAPSPSTTTARPPISPTTSWSTSPAGNFNGTDSFTYVVTSGGVTETATVSVTINAVNDAPVYTGTAVGTAFTENGSRSPSRPLCRRATSTAPTTTTARSTPRLPAGCTRATRCRSPPPPTSASAARRSTTTPTAAERTRRSRSGRYPERPTT